MMQKVTMIIGEPAAGKSTLMRRFLERAGTPKGPFKRPYLVYHVIGNCVILGDYSDPNQPYPGTDRMSMACQPKVIDFIWRNPQMNFIFEGDRLGNIKMIESIRRSKEVDFQIGLVIASDIRARQAQRNQSAKFQLSRSTKISNICRHLVDTRFKTRLMICDTPADTDFHVDRLIQERM